MTRAAMTRESRGIARGSNCLARHRAKGHTRGFSGGHVSNSRIGKAITQVFSDGQVSLAEWNQTVVPVANQVPKLGGPDGCDLVRFVATADQYEALDPEIVKSAVQHASSFGYEITG